MRFSSSPEFRHICFHQRTCSGTPQGWLDEGLSPWLDKRWATFSPFLIRMHNHTHFLFSSEERNEKCIPLQVKQGHFLLEIMFFSDSLLFALQGMHLRDKTAETPRGHKGGNRPNIHVWLHWLHRKQQSQRSCWGSPKFQLAWCTYGLRLKRSYDWSYHLVHSLAVLLQQPWVIGIYNFLIIDLC